MIIIGECSNLTCQVTPQDLETVLVTWSGTHHGPVEIVFGPLGVRWVYYELFTGVYAKFELVVLHLNVSLM